MPTAPPPPAKPSATRAELAFHLLNTIRREKSPPLVRYCILFALARKGAPMTGQELAHAFGQSTMPASSIDNCLRHDLIAPAAHRGPRDGASYQITATGTQEITRLLTITPPKIV